MEKKKNQGRPQRTNTLLQRKLAKLVYLDPQTEQQLKIIKAIQNYSYTEVIFTALREFLDIHCHDGQLDEDGQVKVDCTIDDYKIRN